MNYRTLIGAILALMVALTSGATAAETAPAPAPPAGAEAAQAPTAADLVAKMPLASVEEGRKVAAELVKLGAPGLKDAVGLLLPPGGGDDAKARFALNGVAWYVNRPGAKAERALFAGVVIGAIDGAQPGVKPFLVYLLQRAGEAEAVATLSKLLGDAELCDPAARALINIGTQAAATALLQALPGSQGPARLTLIQALGEMRAAAAGNALLPLASDADAAVRQAALDALANIGAPAAETVLVDAAQAKGVLARAHATANTLLFARRLAEQGGRTKAVAIFRDLIKTRTEPREVNVVANALSSLVTVAGTAALPDVLGAADSENKALRAAALELTRGFRGENVTRAVAAKLKGASPDARVDILYALRVRGDKSAVPAILAALKDEDVRVRLAAVDAAAYFATPQAASALLALAPADPDEAKAVQAALLRLPPAAVGAAAVAALPKADSAAQRLSLLQFLGSRRASGAENAVFACTGDEDAGVRVAALKTLGRICEVKAAPRLIDLMLRAPEGAEGDAALQAVTDVCGRAADADARVAPILARLAKSTGVDRLRLLDALAQVGGPKALQALLAETKSGDAEARGAATRLIAGWEDAEAAPELLKFAQTAEKDSEQVLALRGYIRLVGAVDRPAAEAIRMYQDGLAACKRVDEKRLVLAGLGGVRDLAALKLVGSFVDDKEMGADAVAAALRIVTPADDKDKPLRTPEAIAEIKRLATTSQSGDARDKFYAFIKKYLQAVEEPDPADLAKGKPVTATVPSQGAHNPELAVDGNTTDLNSAWYGAKFPAALTIDLQKVQKIDCVHVFMYYDGVRYYQYTVEVSPDGQAWSKVGDRSTNTTPAAPAGDRIRFEAVDARYVRLSVLKNSINEAVHVVEVKVYAPGGAPAMQAAAAAPQRPADAEGFVPLSVGDDLSGWVGAVGGYCAVDGTIACIKEIGGNLYTAQEYGDFVLRFEFRLTPGANNGIGVRAPLSGDSAYAGMEIQVLDDTAEVYKSLQPYQYHGSVYGIAPCERGHQKPVGEWNEEEITARGRQITVKLNGVTITDVDLDKASVDGTMDHKQHPGLKNERGHIGFLGHGALVEYRNVRVKDLSR